MVKLSVMFLVSQMNIWVLIMLHSLLWVTPTFSLSCMCVGICLCSVGLRIEDSILHNASILLRAKFLSCFEPSRIIDFKRIYYVTKWLHTAVEKGIKLVLRDWFLDSMRCYSAAYISSSVFSLVNECLCVFVIQQTWTKENSGILSLIILRS